MASDNEACCESDPNFAVICGFLEKFGVTCGLANIDFLDLQDMLENSQEVPQELVDLHVKLLRKARKSVSSERWERAIIKLCHGFCSQDAWEIERFGYKKARLSSKLRILKELLEMQFDYNVKFKNEINKLSAEELRTQPLGKDRLGHIYWFQSDNSCQIRVYKEDPDEETWSLVAKDREGLVGLITHLGDGNQTVVNEDSNSLESEKPVVDTGQTDSNSNSNSSKLDQVTTDTSNESTQVEVNTKEEMEDEKPDINDESNAPTSVEIIKPTKIRLRGKKVILNEDSNQTAEMNNGTKESESNGNNIAEQESKSENNIDKDDKEKSLSSSSKGGISIRIKPISELISPSSSVEVNKKVEITGVKEKYIRSDSTSSSSVHHRKAVDSAGFDVHTNFLKRPIDEEEDVEEPSYIKRPRVDRPTLLGNKRKKPSSDEEEGDEDEEVTDEVQEPLMLIRGEGSGQDNENSNCQKETCSTEEDSPIIGEAIEEPVMYFYGIGMGRECETGNDGSSDKKDVSAQDQNTTQSKADADSTSGLSKPEANKVEISDSIKDSESSNSLGEAGCSVKLSAKPEFKLGTIIDVRTNNLNPCVKNLAKKSRWDIGKPEEVAAVESQINDVNNGGDIGATKEMSNNFPEKDIDANIQIMCNKSDTEILPNVKSSNSDNESADLPSTSKGKVQELVSKWEKFSTSHTNEEIQKPQIIEESKVDKIEATANENSSNTKVDDASLTVTPKKTMFFFGPGCLQVKPTISPLKSNLSTELWEKDSAEDQHTSNIFTELCEKDSPEDQHTTTSQTTNQSDLEKAKELCDNMKLACSERNITPETDNNNGSSKTEEVLKCTESTENQQTNVFTNTSVKDNEFNNLSKLNAECTKENNIKVSDTSKQAKDGETSHIQVKGKNDIKDSLESSETQNLMIESSLEIAADKNVMSPVENIQKSGSNKLLTHLDSEKLEIKRVKEKVEDIQLNTQIAQDSNVAAVDITLCKDQEQVDGKSDAANVSEKLPAQVDKGLLDDSKECVEASVVGKNLNLADKMSKDAPDTFKIPSQIVDKGALIKCEATSIKKLTAEVLNTGETKMKDEVDQVCISSSNSIVPANHHVPKSNISVSETIKNDSSNDNESVDKSSIKVSEVPVNEPHTSVSSLIIETEKSKEVVGLPVIEKHTESLNTSVIEDKPKSKLENVLEKINQVKLTQKTDNIDVNIESKQNLLPDTESKAELHSVSSENTKCPKEVEVATNVGKELPDSVNLDGEIGRSIDVKNADDTKTTVLLNKSSNNVLHSVDVKSLINVKDAQTVSDSCSTKNSGIEDESTSNRAQTVDKVSEILPVAVASTNSQVKTKVESTIEVTSTDKLANDKNVCNSNKSVVEARADASVDVFLKPETRKKAPTKESKSNIVNQLSSKLDTASSELECTQKMQKAEDKLQDVSVTSLEKEMKTVHTELELNKLQKTEIIVAHEEISGNKKDQDLDEVQTSVKGSAHSKISSVDKSLKTECKTDVTEKNVIKSADKSSISKTPDAISNSEKSRLSKSRNQIISLTDMLSTSMKVPETVPKSKTINQQHSNSFSRNTTVLDEKSDIVVKSSVVKDTVLKPSVVKDTMVKPSVVKDTMVKASVVKDTVVKPSVVKDTMVKSSVAKATMVKPSVKDTMVKSPVVKDATVKSTVVKDTTVKPSVKDTMVKTPVVKDAMVKPSVVKDTMVKPSIKDTIVKSSVVKDAIVKSTVVKDTTVKPSVGKDTIANKSDIVVTESTSSVFIAKEHSDDIKTATLAKDEHNTGTKSSVKNTPVVIIKPLDIDTKINVDVKETVEHSVKETDKSVDTIVEKSAALTKSDKHQDLPEEASKTSLENISMKERNVPSENIIKDPITKSISKNLAENIQASLVEEKVPTRRITRRTRSSTMDKPPDVNVVNKDTVSESKASVSLNEPEEVKLKNKAPQVCLQKIDVNLNSGQHEKPIENVDLKSTETVMETRKRGKGAEKSQHLEETEVKKELRSRGRASAQSKKNKSAVQETVEQEVPENNSGKSVTSNRELRERKVSDKNKPAENEKKPKGKQALRGKLPAKTVGKEGAGKQKVKSKDNLLKINEDRTVTRTRSMMAKDKELASKAETGKENVDQIIENTSENSNLNLEDIEEQIVRTEIRPSKKLKLSDSVEVTVVDKNKRVVTTHTIEKGKKQEKILRGEDADDKKETTREEKVLDKKETTKEVKVLNKKETTKEVKVLSKMETTKEEKALDKKETTKEEKTLDIVEESDQVEGDVKDQNLAASDSKNQNNDKSLIEKSEQEITDNAEELKPVDEPKCIQKKVALLTCVDINKLKEPSDSKPESSQDAQDVDEKADDMSDSDVSCGIGADADSSDGIVIIPESDPLACSDEDSNDEVKNSQPAMTLATFKLDIDESTPAPSIRITRKRAAQQSIDALRDKKTETENKDNADHKRPKLKQKRSVDRNLRRSIEEKKSKEISSSEDDAARAQLLVKEDGGKKSKSIAKRRVSTRSTRATESPAVSSDAPSEASRTDTSNTPPVTKQRKPRQMKKTLLGLEISPETESIIKEESHIGVRQSRRIAQIKIKEEAERRKLEEVTLYELKEEQRKRKGKKDEDKDYKQEKRKRNKNLPTEDETTGDAESDEKKKRKRKRKHRDPRKQFDVSNPWKSSSGSSSSEIEEEEEEIEDEDDSQLVFRSDHEFSPESDMEEGGEIQPLKRARTARKESDPEEEVDDCACQKCGQKDHPEWILLCDSCDRGWHCSCLRPALLVIPEGDWFCPPCQHVTLVKNLETQLLEYDKKLNKRVMETRRKERLAYVGISLDNVLPSKESDEYRNKQRHHHSEEDNKENESDESGSEESGSDSDSSSSSDSDSEPIYQLRERRQAHSYRFNDYDELINSAIQDELEAVKGAGNQGRGKDISTIVNAEKEEEAQRLKKEAEATDIVGTDGPPPDYTPSTTEVGEQEPLPPVVPIDYDKKNDIESDDEPIRPVRRIIGKKKHRKLNSLDVSSGDDAESDEDFKGSSSSDSEEDFDDDEYAGSDSSDEVDNRRGKRRKDFGPVRRSTRARISRYDKDFINDDTDSENDAPRRKKTRSVWDESESEESDRSWGRRKRKSGKSKRKPSGKPKKSKKKKKKRGGDDSDPEVYRKRPNIKFGGLNDEEDVGRRTRGKKINYLEALGTDSEEEIRRKPPRIEESEEEYMIHEDEDFQQHQLQNDKDSDESGVENVLKDLPIMTQPRPKPRGRGKAGLKIPRKPKEPSETDLFPPLMPDVPQPPNFQASIMPVESTIMQQQQQPLGIQQLLLESPIVQDQELQDTEDEPNPIEQINKNIEQMNEQEMEKMMEEEDYANKQLQLVALQIEKEKKRKEREAKRLENFGEKEQKIPKKRGRKPKNQMLGMPTDLVPPFSESSSMLMNSTMANNAELSEPPGVNLPMFSEIAPVLNADGTPKKRRGRDSPMHGSKLGIATPPQPFSQSQPTPSVITRMLQSQPGQANFSSGGAKYFAGPAGDSQLGPPTTQAPYHPGATGPRGPMPGAYQQPPPGMSHYPVVRSGPAPPHRLHSPGPPGLPPMYHSHRSMDPSPSGGGPINVPATNRDRHSPAVVPPSSSSPLSKGDPTPPPPPYTRPQVGHFPPVTGSSASLAPTGPRHVSMVPPHLQQHRASNMSPYHPGVPSNYHYGSYPPPPPLNTDEGQPPPVYPSSTYQEPYTAEGGAPVQPTENSGNKSFDEETGGEFVGLVSYFSSQREDDLET